MKISKTGFRRLHKLVDYMDSLPKSANKHFDMKTFFHHENPEHEHLIPDAPTVKDLHTCGTSACALGWAMTVPAFRRAGLELSEDEVMNSHEVFGLPDFWSEDGDELWESFFGGENKDKTPRAWAKRVRRLLKKIEAEAA